MIKIGVIGTADIAKRKMIPAIKKLTDFVEYVGVAIAKKEEWEFDLDLSDDGLFNQKKKEKAQCFVQMFGGKVYEGYESLINDEDIDAVYIPLPPALHYKWAKLAILNKKHVLLEKPFTISYEHTKELLELAQINGVVVWENYAFCYHKQFEAIKQMIRTHKIGKVCEIKANFGFPFRGAEDFRYNKKYGGGALLDCGGYTIKAALELMDDDVSVDSATLIYEEPYDVDLYGNITLVDKNKQVAHLSFGMNNYYQCKLEVWGEKGLIIAPRIFTAPEDFEAIVEVHEGKEDEIYQYKDDQFEKSVLTFVEHIEHDKREYSNNIERLSRIIDGILKEGQKEG